MEEITFGIIGMSPGNGHPYSWSAICNGYDAGAMADCPFPVIPEYLAQQKWPAARLPATRVTHVWTQERATSEHIAAATHIPHIANHLTDMIGKVDAVLLARDDPERHYEMAAPFLKAGIPIYIDKPLAINVSTADTILSLARYPWYVYSCSALRYAPELQLSDEEREQIGPIVSIEAIVPKSWKKYAVHVLEPALALLDWPAGPVVTRRFDYEDQRHVSYALTGGRTLGVRTMGVRVNCPLELRVYGEQGFTYLRFTDAFTAFRAALSAFADQVRKQALTIPHSQTMRVVDYIEKGWRS